MIDTGDGPHDAFTSFCGALIELDALRMSGAEQEEREVCYQQLKIIQSGLSPKEDRELMATLGEVVTYANLHRLANMTDREAAELMGEAFGRGRGRGE